MSENNLLEQIQQLTKAAKEISAKTETERKEYIDALKSAYAGLQEAVHPVINETAAILHRFRFIDYTPPRVKPMEWSWGLSSNELSVKKIIHSEAVRFANKYGYDAKLIEQIILDENVHTWAQDDVGGLCGYNYRLTIHILSE